MHLHVAFSPTVVVAVRALLAPVIRTLHCWDSGSQSRWGCQQIRTTGQSQITAIDIQYRACSTVSLPAVWLWPFISSIVSAARQFHWSVPEHCCCSWGHYRREICYTCVIIILIRKRNCFAFLLLKARSPAPVIRALMSAAFRFYHLHQAPVHPHRRTANQACQTISNIQTVLVDATSQTEI